MEILYAFFFDCSIIFFMSVALTGSAFITERKEGMLNRTLVSGVTTGEIITAHLLTQYVIMAGQTILVLAVMVWIFQVEILGSVTSAVVLTLFQGTCGMAYGNKYYKLSNSKVWNASLHHLKTYDSYSQ